MHGPNNRRRWGQARPRVTRLLDESLRFGIEGQIEATATGDEKFSPRPFTGLQNGHSLARCRQHFRRCHTRGSAADNQ